MYPEPLSLSHSIDAGAMFDIAKPMLDGRKHNVANIVSSVAARGRYPAHRFAIAAVQGEGDPQWLAVLTPKLEAIGAPALVASRHGNPAVMSARNGGASRFALQQQASSS